MRVASDIRGFSLWFLAHFAVQRLNFDFIINDAAKIIKTTNVKGGCLVLVKQIPKIIQKSMAKKKVSIQYIIDACLQSDDDEFSEDDRSDEEEELEACFRSSHLIPELEEPVSLTALTDFVRKI